MMLDLKLFATGRPICPDLRMLSRRSSGSRASHHTSGESPRLRRSLPRSLRPANTRAPQRLHVGAVDAMDVEHLVMNLPQRLHVLLGEDVALHGFHGDSYGVAEVCGRSGARASSGCRDAPAESSFRSWFAAGPAPPVEEKRADQQAENDHRRPVVEYQALEERRRLLLVRSCRLSRLYCCGPDPRPMARRCEHHPALPGSGCLWNRR